MAIDMIKVSKNPAQSGIFCFRVVLTAVILICTLASLAQPKLELADWKQNFGFVKKGELVKLVYKFSNKGNQPLLISDAEISCSCTSVDFPRQPVLPGQEASITLTFDTKTVYYRQDRIVYLNSNDPRGPAKIRYKGVVLKD